MASNFEKWLIGTLDINDGVKFTLEDFTFKQAEAKTQWADNPDADGAVLVQEPDYTNAYFEAQIRVEPQASMDAALKALGELTDALQACARTEGGQPIPWTPAESSRTKTWYALLGELEEVPITPSGDLAGWFVRSPIVKVKLTCRPFGYGEERVALAAASSTAPLQVVYIEGVGGDVPAEATLRVTDKALQDRRYIAWSQDVVASATGNPALELVVGAGLSVAGFSGTLTARSGSESAQAAKASLGQGAVTICSTGNIADIGSFRLGLRCQCAEGALFRASCRVGDGPWANGPWVSGGGRTNGVNTEWRSIDLREAFFKAVEKGPQSCEVRIQGKMEEGFAKSTAYVDLLDLMPTRRYGVGHAPMSLITPSAFSVSDAFDQAAGNATGKEADVGGVYAAIANSSPNDFTISGGVLKRLAVSDAGTIGTWPFIGRAIGTATKFKNVALAFDYAVSAESGEKANRWGAILSYVDNTHFVMVNLFRNLIGAIQLVVQNPAGEVLASSEFLKVYNGPTTSTLLNCRGSLLIVINGNTLAAYSESESEPLRQVALVENALIGVEGNAALYDQRAFATLTNREFDNLEIWVPEVPVVCPSGRAVEIRSDSEERENSAGTLWSPLPEHRGSHFLLDPAGEDHLVNRVAVKMRRNDLTEQPEVNLADEQSIEVLVRERFLAPR